MRRNSSRIFGNPYDSINTDLYSQSIENRIQKYKHDAQFGVVKIEQCRQRHVYVDGRGKYSQEEAQNASLAATQWKQEQLKKQAKSLLTEKAYKQFENIIYPSQIEPPKMSREQAVEELKKLKISKSKLSKSK